MSRPIPHLPWTRNGGAPTDGALKRIGGIFAGEAGSERESKKENHKAEIDRVRADLEKAKEYMRAVKKITALRQKEWESSREYGKRAMKLRAKLPDTSDEHWLIECFIDGIYGCSRRRRVRSRLHKTDENLASLKTTINDLRHWRRLPREYADDSESESDDDSMSDGGSDPHESVDDSMSDGESDPDECDSYQPRQLKYVLVETISAEILSDALVFQTFLEKNNFIPNYPPSGPYSFESITQLQAPGWQQLQPLVKMEATAQREAPDDEEGMIGTPNSDEGKEAKNSTFNKCNLLSTTNDSDGLQSTDAIARRAIVPPKPLVQDPIAGEVSDELWEDRVYNNATGGNEMEKWREKPTVEREPRVIPMDSSPECRTGQQGVCELENRIQVASSIPEFLEESSAEPMNGQNSEQGGNDQLFVWPPPAKDAQEPYERPETALYYLNQRLSEGYAVGRARARTPALQPAATDDSFNGPQVGANQENQCERAAKTGTSGRGYQPCDFDGLTPPSAIRGVTDEDIRTAREWEPGGTGRIIVRLSAVKTEIGERAVEAVAMDSGTGVLEVEQKERSLQVVEEGAHDWRGQVDGCCSELSLQGLIYGDGKSWRLGADWQEVLGKSRIAEVVIAAACGDASTWVFGMSCGGKLRVRGIAGIVAVTWVWDPGGGALGILAFVLLPAGT